MSDITIHVDGDKFDLDDFELGELEWLEEFIGMTLNEQGALSSMKAAVGFAYLVKRRSDPEFTVEQARKVKLGALDASDEPEKPAVKKRPPKPAAR